MNHTPILVLGAGELGLAVLRSLSRRIARLPGTDLAVLVRPATLASSDPVKQRDLAMLRALGVRLVPGDLAADSPAALAALFGGFHTVVSCTGFVGGRGTQLKIARAALAAGVARYVPWQFGVDYDVIGRGSAQDLFDEQLDVRDLLRAQGRTAWLIVSTGMFTSFLFEPSFGVVDLAQNTVHALGGWDTAVTVTTAEDIGALTTEILLHRAAHRQPGRVHGGRHPHLRAAGGRRGRRPGPAGRAGGLERGSQLKEELAQDPDNATQEVSAWRSPKACGVAWDQGSRPSTPSGGSRSWMSNNGRGKIWGEYQPFNLAADGHHLKKASPRAD